MSATSEKIEGYWASVRPNLLPLKPMENGDAVTYHRHWVLLARNVTLPIFFCIAEVFVWGYFLSHGDVARLLGLGVGPNLGILAASVLPWGWLLWRYEDWRNDYYVVTSDRIIDVDRRPFGFGGEVREAPMANVQNVAMRIPGFLASLLDFGDINVETAGQQSSLVFYSIHHPRDVLARVAAKVDAFRETRLVEEHRVRQEELTTWFSTYADLNRITIIESPSSARVGDTAEVSWRVSGQATDVDTWLDWRLGEAVYRVSQQAGGPGNYRGRFVVPLCQDVPFSAGARIMGTSYESSDERLVVSDFEFSYPAEAHHGQSLAIQWTHEALASHAEVLWDTRSHGREDAYPHLETASLEEGWWSYSFIPPLVEAIYFHMRARVGGALIYSPEHKISLSAPHGHVEKRLRPEVSRG